MSGFWKQRNVFVTGATGLVGSWVVKRLLALDARVIALVRDMDPQSELRRSGAIDEIRIVNGALEDYRTLERAISEHEAEVVIHLGAQTIVATAQRSPLATFESNIRGTYNLLEACRAHRPLVQRVVVASSDKAYGAHDGAYEEGMTLNPRHPYEVSKACTDLLAQTYHASYGLPVAVARCGNIYGGGDLNWSRIVPGTIRSLLAGERPIIRSDGKFIRDYFYVEDASQAYLTLAEQLDRPEVQGRAFNFSTETPMSVLELVALIQRLMDSRLEPDIRNEATHEIVRQTVSAATARRVLGWTPRWSMDEGLSQTIDWYRAYTGAAATAEHVTEGRA